MPRILWVECTSTWNRNTTARFWFTWLVLPQNLGLL